MENPRHREAIVLFSAQSERRRSEYVVDCILQAQQENRLDETIRRIISEALKDVAISTPIAEKATVNLHTTENLSDLPDVLLSSLDDI
jgi:hypothetical protein